MNLPRLATTVRMIRNIAQIAVIALGMLLVGYAGSIFSANLFFNSVRGMRLMNDGLRGYCYREFKASRIHLGFSLRCTIDDFQLSRTYGFSAGTAFAADRIRFQLHPSVFLLNHPRLSSVHIDGLRVSVAYPALSRLLALPSAHSSAGSSAGTAGMAPHNQGHTDVVVDAVTIGGVLCVMDVTGQKELVRLRNMLLRANHVSSTVPFDVEMEADMDAHGRTVRVDAAAMADSAGRNLKVTRGSIDKLLSFMGEADVNGLLPRYRMSVSGSRATWDRLMSLALGTDEVRTSLNNTVHLLISGTPEEVRVDNQPQN